MIPILYEARTMFYDTNGLGGLPHAISCTVTEERNGQYYLEMEYPASGLHGSELGVDRIIYAAPAPKKRPQPFVIERIEQDIDGILKIYAPHISRLLTKRVANVQAVNDSITSPRGAAATMQIILNNSTPSNSDFPVFTTESHMNNALKSIHVSGVAIPAMSCLMGARGSVLDVFGGEFEFDETNIILWLNRGTETGLEIRYGANMSKLEAETDAADLITACVPFWSSGEKTVVGDQCSADTAANFSFVRCAPLDVTETLGTDAVPTVAEVTAAGQAYIDATESRNLSTSIDVESPPVAIVPFNVQPPPDRSVYLCDTVTVVHPSLQLKQTAKIVACVFNVLTEQYNSVTVGQLRRDISDTIAGLIQSGSSGGSYVSSGGGSAENVLSYPRAAVTTVTGVTLSYNEETGLFTLNGTNGGTENAIIGASAGTIQDGTALKPPAGVYRLELRCEQGMNPDVFWGVFYIGSRARYVLTDATGDTVEVYLDGNTMASAGVVVAPGKTADHLTLSFALRRVGTPEIGKLLVDQINHTQALQRKVLSMLDTLKSATQAISILDNFVLLNAPNASDLNAIGRNTYLTIARYNSSTLNSPYKQSSSLCGGHDCGLVFAYQAAAASGGSLGVQVGLVAGNVTSDGVSSGRALIRSVSGTTWTDWRVL